MTCHREKNTSTSARSREVVIFWGPFGSFWQLPASSSKMFAWSRKQIYLEIHPLTLGLLGPKKPAVGKLDYTSAQHGGLKGSSKKHQETMLSTQLTISAVTGYYHGVPYSPPNQNTRWRQCAAHPSHQSPKAQRATCDMARCPGAQPMVKSSGTPEEHQSILDQHGWSSRSSRSDIGGSSFFSG